MEKSASPPLPLSLSSCHLVILSPACPPKQVSEESMTIQEKVYFLRQFQREVVSIGALLPTSRYAARAMASECTRRASPKTILEVGPGTGAITAAIVECMGPDDRLVLCELNAGFIAYLRGRFETEPAFRRV